ncbi:MAG: alpha amylase C-terminal domain-containing protein, partial [Clostridia bacterium]|nr:alpha amylase C-terminal domain-containing protein [Clostridia bacterium]
LIAVLNYTPVAYEDFQLEVPDDGTYVEVFNTDDVAFGGSGVTNTGAQFRSEQIGGKHAVRLRLPPLGVTVLRCTRKKATRKKSRT